MDPPRRGQRLGWTLGWLGGFVWVLILTVVMLVQGLWLQGLIGLAICIVAVVTIQLWAPWRHPTTRYRSLMLPIYALFALSVVWGVWAVGDPAEFGIHGAWSLLILLPVFLPLLTAGRYRWQDGETEPESHG